MQTCSRLQTCWRHTLKNNAAKKTILVYTMLKTQSVEIVNLSVDTMALARVCCARMCKSMNLLVKPLALSLAVVSNTGC